MAATTPRSLYGDGFSQIARQMGHGDIDPFHVECWMRLQHRTLDALSAARFREEVETAIEMVLAYPEESAQLARTYT